MNIFVSYFDFYKPEAYIPKSDLYIEKTSRNNKDLEAMRMSALNALSIRRDTIVVASVAAIYAEFNPKEYIQSFMPIESHMKIKLRDLLTKLVNLGYEKHNGDLSSGQFFNKGKLLKFVPDILQKTISVLRCLMIILKEFH